MSALRENRVNRKRKNSISFTQTVRGNKTKGQFNNMASFAMERPVPLIISGESDQKFTINKEAVDYLRGIDKPLSVVAIVGKYRTGKSYLMNRLYGKNSGFDLGSTVQSKTKGIWMWARPHPRDSNRCLLLLDTEGLHDVEKGDATNDIQLFTLAVLLCNCFVYNSQGTIDADAIKRLHLVAELTEHIKIHSGNTEEESGEAFSQYFPQFMWVVRDFTLQLSIDGQTCTPDEYLEHALLLKRGHGKAVRDYNGPRECIRAFFPHRKCFVLKKPVDDDELLQKLDTAREEEIKPQFLEDVKKFCEEVWTRVDAFQVQGNTINGSRYLTLAETYVQAINNGAVPCIGTAVDTMMQVECQRALDESVACYSDMMERNAAPNMPLSLQELSSVHENANEASLRVYQEKAIFDSQGNFQKKLQECLLSIYEQYVKRNKEASRKKCKAILQNAYADIVKKIQDGYYTGSGGYKKYQGDFQKVKDTYNKTERKGPCADEELALFNEAKKSEGMSIMEADKKMSIKDKELALAKEEAEQQALQAKSLQQRQQQLQQELADKEASNLAMLQQVQAEFDEKINSARKLHEADMQAKQEEHQRLLREGLHQQAEQYKEMLADMQKNQDKLQEQQKQQTAQLQESLARQEQLINEIRQNKTSKGGGGCVIL